jgi:hypothetical protein
MKSYTQRAGSNFFRWVLATIVCFMLFIANNTIVLCIVHIGSAIGILIGIMAVGFWQNEHEISKRIDFILRNKQKETEIEMVSNTAKAEI